MQNGYEDKPLETPIALVMTQLERVSNLCDDAAKQAEAIGTSHRDACQRRDELLEIREALVAVRDRLRGMQVETDPTPAARMDIYTTR